MKNTLAGQRECETHLLADGRYGKNRTAAAVAGVKDSVMLHIKEAI